MYRYAVIYNDEIIAILNNPIKKDKNIDNYENKNTQENSEVIYEIAHENSEMNHYLVRINIIDKDKE
jgi:hypothetical protein